MVCSQNPQEPPMPICLVRRRVLHFHFRPELECPSKLEAELILSLLLKYLKLVSRVTTSALPSANSPTGGSPCRDRQPF